jgi:imidazoleglycerol-phosphate dehydratase
MAARRDADSPRRAAEVARKTKETDVACRLALDGTGATEVTTGVGFLDHMLELLGRHALVDLAVTARGDTRVDAHHTVEDVGIVLGQAVRKALTSGETDGGVKGIRRFGFASVPMDEALAEVSLDVSGRGRAELAGSSPDGAPLAPSLVEGFLQAFASNAGVTVHVEVRRGRDAHHVIEAVFKALARALREAVSPDSREKGVPSTKGRL